jgi:hypothetical protein
MMKKILMAAGLALASLHSMASPNVGVSVSVGQPGFYGRIDVGHPPPAAVIYPQPVIIQRPPVYVDRSPIYLRVPPGHQKNWGRYCGRYQACGQPVYFVRDDWYREHFHRPPPVRRIDDRHDRRDWRDDRRGHRHDHRDHRDHRDDRGHHGNGHGKGHGRD